MRECAILPASIKFQFHLGHQISLNDNEQYYMINMVLPFLGKAC